MAAGKGKFILIDGNSLLHRAFHALPTMTTSTGQHTNAVYGFATMLMRLLDTEKPTHFALAFDKAAPTFRHIAYEAYKAHRPKMPDELRSQIPLVRELVEAFNIPVCELEGYEADDVIGTLACQSQTAGFDVVIVTGDKDALQLVKPGLSVLITRKGITEMDRFDTKLVQEKLGVAPEQVVDLKALMGDASDNIPGVPGIGAKTAAKLLGEYRTLANVLANAEHIAGKVGATLRDHQEDAILSQSLATIDINAPIDFTPADLEYREPNVARLAALFTQIEARALLGLLTKRFPHAGQAASTSIAAPPPLHDEAPQQPAKSDKPADAGLLVLPGMGGEPPTAAAQLEPRPVAEKAWNTAIDNLSEPLTLVASLQQVQKTDPADSFVAVCGVPHSLQPQVAQSASAECLFCQEHVADLYINLLKSGRHVIAHDTKTQILAAAMQGVAVPEPEDVAHLDDLQVASYLVNPSQGDHSLADLAVKHGYAPPAPWNAAKNGADTHTSDTEWRNALSQRVAVLQAAAPLLLKRIEHDGLASLYRDVEMPLLAVLANMERVGIAVDKKRLADMSREMAAELERLTGEIYAAAGEEFNINSPKQLAAILFDKLRLPVKKSTKTGPSTSAEVLEELAGEHELPRLLLDYRQLVKLTSTYVDALPQQINPRTGRIHTTFNQTVAATGRLSSTNPNLQNIPVRTALGRQIRGAFVPGDPDWLLVSADYSQIELRVLAHLAQDANLVAAFQAGADIHTKTAAEVFGVDPADVTSEMRSGAKAINFGIVYGISSFGLARGTGLSRSDAQAYIKSYFARYPGVKQYMEDIVAQGRLHGYVSTILGRRRYLPDLSSKRWQERSFAERTAMNTPIQGSAADIIKLAMLKVYRRLRDEGMRTRMLLQVHDELLFETPRAELNAAVAIIRAEMESAYRLDVPLKVDIGAGSNWLDIEELPDA